MEFKLTTAFFLRILSLALILAAAGLTFWQWNQFQNLPGGLPQGSTLGGVPVGGLDPEQASERLLQAYQAPVELHYAGAAIQVDPQRLGFHLDLDAMLAQVRSAGRPKDLGAFWDYLFNQLEYAPVAIPLEAGVDADQVRTYLESEIVPRYDQPPTPAIPLPARPELQPGQPGETLQVDASIQPIQDALRSLSERTVDLPLQNVDSLPPLPEHLQIQLEQILDTSDFGGLAEIYLKDLQTGRTIHFARMNGADVPTEIAFTAASTMKVPIMLSVLKRTAEPTPDWILELMEGMIVRSENPPADSLMEQVIDPVSGPLDVTADMQALGLQNTFIAGYFYLGAPLLQLYDTPANTRTDINLQPDVYNQTTPSEIGRVLEDIYQCAESGSGELISTFSGQISSDECKLVISYLLRNKTALLLEAGVPEGTPIAHKHGWIEEADGLLHTMSDVAIIYTPGGNYVLNVFLYHPVQLVFDPANIMIAQISQAVYNFFNYN
ncbi:MAG: hypothetical protein GYA17_14500 [Chloroflexi bacterium]|nr:hypothetical protein [Chloroflexota bacterium]